MAVDRSLVGPLVVLASLAALDAPPSAETGSPDRRLDGASVIAHRFVTLKPHWARVDAPQLI